MAADNHVPQYSEGGEDNFWQVIAETHILLFLKGARAQEPPPHATCGGDCRLENSEVISQSPKFFIYFESFCYIQKVLVYGKRVLERGNTQRMFRHQLYQWHVIELKFEERSITCYQCWGGSSRCRKTLLDCSHLRESTRVKTRLVC